MTPTIEAIKEWQEQHADDLWITVDGVGRNPLVMVVVPCPVCSALVVGKSPDRHIAAAHKEES